MKPVSSNPSAGSPRAPIATILAVSAAAVMFLLWLLYVHRAPQAFATRLLFLPALNALLNGLSAIALAIGFYFIHHRKVPQHRASMVAAFIFSSLFLVSYIVNHALHGDLIFPGHGTARTVYLSILASHIVLSVVVLPMVLATFYFSLSGRFPQHKRIARFTFPIWLYVSVTGVVVYAMLANWR
ncbi:MAG: DUF420 domain-containing protein [Acidobacteriaceae bacterium]